MCATGDSRVYLYVGGAVWKISNRLRHDTINVGHEYQVRGSAEVAFYIFLVCYGTRRRHSCSDTGMWPPKDPSEGFKTPRNHVATGYFLKKLARGRFHSTCQGQRCCECVGLRLRLALGVRVEGVGLGGGRGRNDGLWLGGYGCGGLKVWGQVGADNGRGVRGGG